jgi:CRP/FNR family transcriptional regulator
MTNPPGDHQIIPIDENLIKELSKIGTKKHFEPGDILLEEGRSIRSIPIVLSGSLKVIREDDDGREILLYYIMPGETCVMSFLCGLHEELSKVKAIVEEPSDIILIPIRYAPELLNKFPAWNEFIFKLYHKRFEELLSVVNAIAFHKMDERLLETLEKKRKSTGSNEIAITHQHLAEEMGSVREVVSRLLKQLEKNGKVVLGRNKITLLSGK